MRFHRQGCAAALLLCLLAICWQAAWADLRVQVEESVNGAEPAAVTHWFGDDRTMRDDSSRYIITRLDQQKSYVVNREKLQYRVVDLDLRPDEAIPDVTVTRTDDVRNIGEWTARRYRLSGPATRDLTIDIWITRDLDVDITPFRRLMIKLGNRPGSEWLKAYKEIQGFPVLQQVELKRPGIKLRTQSRVIRVEQAEPDADTYNPPDDYRRVR